MTEEVSACSRVRIGLICVFTLLAIGRVMLSYRATTDWRVLLGLDTLNDTLGHSSGRSLLGVNTTRDRLLTIMPRGRLGNNMLQYVSLMEIGRLTGRSSELGLGFMQLQRTFNISLPLRPRHVAQDWTTIPIDTQNVSVVGDADLDRIRDVNGHVMLDCRCLLPYYAHQIRDLVAREFSFRQSVARAVGAYWDRMRARETVSVGVHIRGSDYNTTERRQKGYGTPPLDFYTNAMEYFRTKYSRNVTFIICSDDIRWAEKHIRGNDVIYSHHKPEVDLAILTSCDHVILCRGSTFSFWAGWLNQGTALYNENNSTLIKFANFKEGLHDWLYIGT